ncbi:Zinc finger protein ZAT11, partial [Mucuna pruriens]
MMNPQNSPSEELCFECKSCEPKFALDGHNTNHKKPKLEDGNGNGKQHTKIHECSICGETFSRGQALGGHMRKHKDRLLKRSNNSSQKIMFHDLNLTPLQNDLKSRSCELNRNDFRISTSDQKITSIYNNEV